MFLHRRFQNYLMLFRMNLNKKQFAFKRVQKDDKWTEDS